MKLPDGKGLCNVGRRIPPYDGPRRYTYVATCEIKHPYIPTSVDTDAGKLSIEDARKQGYLTDERGLCLAHGHPWHFDEFNRYGRNDVRYVRVVVRCPLCKRKLVARQCMDNDGCPSYRLPHHKPKGWWKKKGKPGSKKRGGDGEPRIKKT